jgi:hypothetical protein
VNILWCFGLTLYNLSVNQGRFMQNFN